MYKISDAAHIKKMGLIYFLQSQVVYKLINKKEITIILLN